MSSDPDLVTRAGAAKRASSNKEHRGPYRILIVDDEPMVRDALARIFRDSNLDCELDTAHNGVAAAIKIRSFRPHLLVLDIVMPELDGAELCHVIRSSDEAADAKVLLLTGYPDDIRLQSALLAGADAWLAKPSSPEAVLGKARELLAAAHPA